MLGFVQVVLVDHRPNEITFYIYLGVCHSEFNLSDTFPASLIDNFQPPTLRNPLVLILGQDSHLFETDLEDFGFRPFQNLFGLHVF
jgi:hypothetical protein